MIAIRVIFDGKAFVPEQPLSLPDRVQGLVYVDQVDPTAQGQIDSAVRAYYQGHPKDADDAAWSSATAPQSHRAWDED